MKREEEEETKEHNANICKRTNEKDDEKERVVRKDIKWYTRFPFFLLHCRHSSFCKSALPCLDHHRQS